MYLWTDRSDEWLTSIKQPEGVVPWGWVTDVSLKMTENGYRDKDQTIQARVKEIANAFFCNMMAMGINRADAEHDANYLYHMKMWGWNTFATPEWVSYGNDKGLAISCFGTYTADSMHSLAEMNAELAMLTKLGGGTSVGLSTIRPRGAPISTGGTADGPVHWAAWVNSTMLAARQGDARRGYCAAYLDGHHPDLQDFVSIGTVNSDIHNITTAVVLDDEFMEKALVDPVYAQRMSAIQESRTKIGFPYIMFGDNVNNQKPQVYKDNGSEITHSNLCVTGDTKVLTQEYGYKRIDELAGQTVSCWNGSTFSETPLYKTSDGQHVVDVVMSNGRTISATPYHKWFVKGVDGGEDTVKRTKELVRGDRFIKFALEGVTHGTKVLPHAYDNGMFTAEGTQTVQRRVYLYGHKRSLLGRLSGYMSLTGKTDKAGPKPSSSLVIEYSQEVLEDKFFVPDNTYCVSSRLTWLAGYFDGDGTLTDNNGTESIQACSTNHEFLVTLSDMLQELGVHSTITHAREAGYFILPTNDGTGESKEYWCNKAERILIAGSGLQHLLALGYTAGRVMPTHRYYNRDARHFVKVVEVVDKGEVLPTYCGTEPLENKLTFNGVVTGNCNEIMLPDTEEESFVCVLASMNVALYDQWKGTPAVRVLTRFLDTVVEESMDKILLLRGKYTEGSDFLRRIHTFLNRHRAIGLGVTGLHHLYQSKSLAFGSQEAAKLNVEIFKYLQQETLAVSKELAKELGSPEVLEGYGLRFTTTMALAPTKSTAAILGGVSESIQPVVANIYIKELSKTTYVMKNPHLVALLESKGMNTDDVWRDITAHSGSVSHMDTLSDHEKDVFKTYAEIDPIALIDQAATRQPYIDQGQSLNLTFHPDASSAYINAVTYYAWKMGIKGLYYQHNMSAAQALNVELLNLQGCDSCGG